MNINNHSVGEYQEWYDGRTVRDVYMIAQDRFEINEISNGWEQIIVTRDTMQKLIEGSLELSSIKSL